MMKRTGEMAAVVALVAMGWGANQFAPLIVMYQHSAGVDVAAAQAMFVLYAVGLVPGLFAGGPLSDRHGRPIVVFLALVVSGLSSALLMLGSVEDRWLYLGRLLAGLASGAGFSAGTAWVKEASVDSHGARRAVIAMTFGFGLGPLVAGLIAATDWHPQTAAYLPHLAMTVLALALAARPALFSRSMASFAPPLDGGAPAAPLLTDKRFLRVVAPLAPWVFLTASVALAVLPASVSTGSQGLVFTALVTPIPAVAGIVVQSLARRLAGLLRSQLTLGFAFAAAGFAVAAWAVTAGSTSGVVIASIMLGCAYGMCQTAGLSEVVTISAPQRLGRNTAIYQALTYVGYLAPLPIVLLTTWVTLPAILIGLAGLAVLTAVPILLHLQKDPR